MNLGAIISRVQRLFGDTSQAQILVSDITAWANDAQVDIVRKTEELQSTFFISTTAAVASYSLPTDFIRMKRVTFNGIKLEPTTLEELDKISPDRDSNPTYQDTPLYWYDWAKTINIYPAPATTGLALVLWYIRTPVVLVNTTDTPEINPDRHEDIVRYCMARAQELDENYGEASNLMREYQDRIAYSKDEANFERDDSYPAIRAVQGDDGVDVMTTVYGY